MSQQQIIERSYEYDPRDLSVAFYRVATERYGVDAIRGMPSNWRRLWIRASLEFISVKAGIDKQVMGIKGALAIEKIPAHFLVGPDAPTVAVFNIDNSQHDEVVAFLDAVGKHLDEHSIYRGQAIDSSGNFLDLSGSTLDDMVYNDKTLRDLKAHVWTIIKRGALCAKVKIGHARKVLFSGPFGSGKTMAALITGQLALQHGYTFFYLKPTDRRAQGALQGMIAFARRYQPSILFIEDCEREQRDWNPHEHGAIMAEIDGIKSKSNRMIVLMTTNYSEKMSEGMLRPGRIDKEISFKVFTAEDMQCLLRKVLPSEWLAPDLDWKAVTDACASFSAAFVVEVGKAAMLLELSDHEDDVDAPCPMIGTEVLLEAARDLYSQHQRSNVKIGFV